MHCDGGGRQVWGLSVRRDNLRVDGDAERVSAPGTQIAHLQGSHSILLPVDG
jgi:hypothetical protein